MLDEVFCDKLEFEITKAFRNSDNAELNGFWCDGILLPSSPTEYSKKIVNDKRQVLLVAYIGKSDQIKYQLFLRFGSKSQSRYARDLDIYNCIPESNNIYWLEVDTENRTITVSLD
jgi:hypothetical protein